MVSYFAAHLAVHLATLMFDSSAAYLVAHWAEQIIVWLVLQSVDQSVAHLALYLAAHLAVHLETWDV